MTLLEVAKRLDLLKPDDTEQVEDQLERTAQLSHGLHRSIRHERAMTTAAWLTFFAALGFREFRLPILSEAGFVSGLHDVFTLTLAAADFVLSWIDVDVFAH